jgi:phage tail-like protein
MPDGKLFVANAARTDPLKNFKFRIFFGQSATPVAGCQKMTALKVTNETIEWRAGDSPKVVKKLLGRASYADVTLEKGLSDDPTFQDWANLAHHTDGDEATSPATFRKDIRLQILNEAGQLQLEYTLKQCWVSEFQAAPDMDSNGKAVAISSIKLCYEGFFLSAGAQADQ